VAHGPGAKEEGMIETMRRTRGFLMMIGAAIAWAGLAGAVTGQSQPPVFAVKGEVLVTNRLDLDFSKYQVTFLELGADRCIPCKKMQPIMKEIAAAFPDRVQVVFYDVWKDAAPAEKYRVQLIPTQVFLDQKGKEIARHVGLFPKEEILELLKKHGIQ
jgi:thioredoxin 1